LKVDATADALIEALASEGREEDLGDVEPTSVLRRVVDFEALRETSRLLGGEGFVEA